MAEREHSDRADTRWSEHSTGPRTAEGRPAPLLTAEVPLDRIEAPLDDELGGIKIRSLERVRVHQLLSDRVSGGLHKKTARRILANLHSILEHAKHDGVIAANPLSGLAKFAGLTQTKDEAQEEIKAFTREELDRFLSAAATTRPAFWILAFVGSRTGARLGEILALRWSDFDWTSRTVRLSRAVTPKGKPTTLKSKAARTVELGKVVVAELRHHKADLQAEALAVGREWSEDTRVFPHMAGQVVTHVRPTDS